MPDPLPHPPNRWPSALTFASLALLAACAQNPNLSKPAQEIVGPTRSLESLRLEKYYASTQARLLAQGLLRTDGGGPDTPFSAATLVRDFEKVALFDEYALLNGRFVAKQTPSALRRWQQPVRIGMLFDDLIPEEKRVKDRANVVAYAKRLARLTGVDIRVTDKNPNFNVLFLYRDRQKTIGPELIKRVPRIDPVVIREIANSPRNTFCVAYAFSDKYGSTAYSSAIILIKAEHSDLMTLSCIHEELAQAMGLANDSPDARPSIFNDDEEFALLTRHDELLLRMLYDPRLKLGMSNQAIRAILPTIARDVLKGNT
ncbi:MAG: DUF2927 domain-containing protein [Alphaproteobacteria bacterium]|nr:DUF2927 domain-containing protein [Alphaproteobacteria bacterium]